MNRRALLVAGTSAAALIVFAGGAYFFSPKERPETTGAPEAATNALLIRAHSPITGPKDAPVTIVEFFDPSCEACRTYYPIVKEILAAHPNKVRVVLRYAAFHQGSAEAIGILETARLQGVFEQVLAALFEQQPLWASDYAPETAKAWEIAATAGLDVERAKRDWKLPAIRIALHQDAADIAALGVRRTPTFFVNGKSLTDFGEQQLRDLVKSEVEAL